jgi:uncharacterized protein YneF (UPF0154 family)
METGLIVLWFVLCFVFGWTLGSLNVSRKSFRYWLLILILASGYMIGFYIGAN